jgi:HK97 family phage portal protein
MAGRPTLLHRMSQSLKATAKSTSAAMAFPLPISGGSIPASWPWNWWQTGKDPIGGGSNSIVQSCVDAYAQTLAQLPAQHVSEFPGEGVQPITTSALSRVLRQPNSYQTRSDFVLNLVKSLLLHGNGYALAQRNDRNEISALHLLNSRSVSPMIDRESGSIFYAIGDQIMLPHGSIDALVPQRDVLHVRLFTPRNPLIGVSPIENLAMAIASTNAISSHQAAFFSNMARPSGLLTTDERLTKEQMMQLRDAWLNQSQHLNSGGVPILAAGLKWQSMSINSQDSQLVEAFQMGRDDIAMSFRIPLAVLGYAKDSTYQSAETLINAWLSQGLGFLIEHIEQSISAFFGVPLNTHCQFDVDALLRTDLVGRVDALTKAISGGLYSPNEARRKEGLPDAEDGDEPRLQAQVVPLSQVNAEPAPSAEPAPVPQITDQSQTTEEAPQPTEEQQADMASAIVKMGAIDSVWVKEPSDAA